MCQLARSLSLLRMVLLWELFLVTQSAFAQSTVSGRISGTNGTILPGATASIVGTNNYAVADQEGRFVLSAKPGDLLQFSFIGYQDHQVVLGNETELNITLTK